MLLVAHLVPSVEEHGLVPLGCAIGDFGTVAFFQIARIPLPAPVIMTLVIVNGRLTFGAMLIWWVVPIKLAMGYVTPLPYNYLRLKALGRACH